MALGVAAADVCKFCSLSVVSDRFGSSNRASDGVRVHSFSKSHVHSAKTGNTKVGVAMVTCCCVHVPFNKLKYGIVQNYSYQLSCPYNQEYMK